MDKARKIKMQFLNIIDGVYDQPPTIKGLDSYRLGICKLEYKNDTLHVHLRRPGLLIGKKGETINLISKELGSAIKICEVSLI